MSADEVAFQMLGLSPAASRPEVVTAYHRLARATHPDHSGEPDAAQRFTALTAAYHQALAAADAATDAAPAAGTATAVTHPSGRPAQAEPHPPEDWLRMRPPTVAGEPAPLIAGPVHITPPAPPDRPTPRPRRRPEG